MFIWLEWFLELLGIRHKKEEPVQTEPVPHPEVTEVEDTISITTTTDTITIDTMTYDIGDVADGDITITIEEDPIIIVPNFQSMTKAQLVEYGASVGIELDMKMKKAEMLEALK